MTGLYFEIGTHRQFNDKPHRLIIRANSVPGDHRPVVIHTPRVHLLDRDAAKSVAAAITAILNDQEGAA